MMGVAGILGGALLSAIHGAPWLALYIKMVIHIQPFSLSPQHSQKKHTPWLQQTGFGLKSLV